MEERLLGENIGDNGKILGVRKTVRASPSLGFRPVTDKIIDIREGFGVKHRRLSNEGSRGVEDEDLGKSSM
jgi:hypothetical protein